MCFSLKCCDFSELCKFCCSAGVWPAIVYTHWHRGETERGQSPKYILNLRKNTIFNEHPVLSQASIWQIRHVFNPGWCWQISRVTTFYGSNLVFRSRPLKYQSPIISCDLTISNISLGIYFSFSWKLKGGGNRYDDGETFGTFKKIMHKKTTKIVF